MPTVFAIQDDLSPLITESAGIYTCVIAVLQSGAMMHLVLTRLVGNLWTEEEDRVESEGDDDHGMRGWRRRSRVAHERGGEGGEGGETKRGQLVAWVCV